MRTLLMLTAILALSTPVFAATTPWQDVAPHVRARLISADVLNPDGTTLVGLDIDMPDNFKTYWRLPGETGIPTRLDTSGSTNITSASIVWPYPTAETTNGFLDYVYRGQTVLPVLLKVGGSSAILKASVLMGVCSDICVPVKAKFTLPLSFSVPDTADDIRLGQALALAPVPGTGTAPAFGAVTFDAGSQSLNIPLGDRNIDPASIIAYTEDPTLIFDAPQKSPDNGAVILPLRGTAKPGGWQDQPVQLTFMTPKGSFEISERVPSATP